MVQILLVILLTNKTTPLRDVSEHQFDLLCKAYKQ